MARLSQVNAAARELAGLEPFVLGDDECVVMSDSDITSGFYREVVERGTVLVVGGTALRVAAFSGDCLGGPRRFPGTPAPSWCRTQRCRRARSSCSRFSTCSAPPMPTRRRSGRWRKRCSTPTAHTWPVSLVMTRTDVADQSVGLSTVVAYLAIYLGFVLVIACAALLAIQQLSDASDNARRYGLVAKLGAPRPMIDGALFAQVLVYFLLFPLLLVVAHACCALAQAVEQGLIIAVSRVRVPLPLPHR